jgi:hypothetical protein
VINKYACVVYALGFIARILLIHFLNIFLETKCPHLFGDETVSTFSAMLQERVGLSEAVIGNINTLVDETAHAVLAILQECSVIFLRFRNLESVILSISASVVSMVEALVALLLLYYMPSTAANQLSDWGVQYILVIIIATSFILSKIYVAYLISLTFNAGKIKCSSSHHHLQHIIIFIAFKCELFNTIIFNNATRNREA